MTPPYPWEMADQDLGTAPPLPNRESAVRRSVERRGGEEALDALHRLERLGRERFQIDPDRHPEKLREIDRECEALIRERLPYLREVVHEAHRELEARRAARPLATDEGDVPPP